MRPRPCDHCNDAAAAILRPLTRVSAFVLLFYHHRIHVLHESFCGTELTDK